VQEECTDANLLLQTVRKSVQVEPKIECKKNARMQTY